jgi:glycosyltransferase involved in cell wall biosynthesis
MITFAFEGITSLSVKPIRMITIGGLLICLISLGMLIKSFVDYFNGNVVPGWASIMVSIWVLGGLQIFAIGIIGEYIGKTYLETKKRPKYIIESVILDDKDISIDRNW